MGYKFNLPFFERVANLAPLRGEGPGGGLTHRRGEYKVFG